MASNWFASLNCPEYLREAENGLRGEEEKVDKYLDPETKPLLLKELHAVVVEEYAQKLADVN